ncbi:MAG: GPP34 family phosphoprotein [Gammaproteobacteria bacterium]|nr:GPP34 family phosphoprotein [Gammaproteobacteria bacterium]MCY4218216.1 GPP34 family phosphoprotein [Gammaproteobacteria bacterium]MCY4274858.1 GPP34 family phosphoprotein [Gammaproteobacteria bacterium]
MNKEANLRVENDTSPVADQSFMITISEEVLLLIFHYDNGCANYELSPRSVRGMIACALLLDLCEQNRVKIDQGSLVIINPAPTGYSFLDCVLSRVGKNAIRYDANDWISHLYTDADAIQNELTELLVNRGILAHRSGGRYFVMGSHNFTSNNGRPSRDVRRRIAGILLCEETPTPRDMMIINLISVYGLWNDLVDETVMNVITPRIDDIVRGDMISRSVINLIESGLRI